MAKLSIITRACNRLEYTVLCIREIEKKIGNIDYEHIIVDQNSTDGTGLWLKSLLKEGYYKIKVKFNDVNTGDAGGMKDGYSISDINSKYIMQFDNDCYPLTYGFGEKFISYMENNLKVGALMGYREGVMCRIKSIGGLHYFDNDKFYDIKRATCCFVTRRDLLDKIHGCWDFKDKKIGWGFYISKNLKNMGYRVIKSETIKIMHTDGTEMQCKKYPLYRKSVVSTKEKPSNFTTVRY